jgi:hypothetical protein
VRCGISIQHMTAVGQLHALPRRSIAVRFTSNQQTLRTHQIIGPCAGVSDPTLMGVIAAWLRPEFALAGGRNVSLADKACLEINKAHDEVRASIRMFGFVDGHDAAFCSFGQHGRFRLNSIVFSIAYARRRACI